MANEKKTESINLADVAKQVEEMLAKAREEAAKIVADAKASVGGELTEEQKEALAKEEAYFLRLSKYQKQLEKYIEENDNFIFPESRKKEMLN